MFSVLLFLFSWGISPPNHAAKADTVSVTGKMWDINTGKDLKLVGTGVPNSQPAESEDESSAIFSLQVPTGLRNLVFRAQGYRTRNIPVNIIDKDKPGQKFELTIPMILLDSEQVITKSYLKDSTLVPDSIACDPAMGKVYFEAVDAANGEVITARICITSTLTGQMKCIETGKGKASVLWLNQEDKMGAGVYADGYDFFSGNMYRVKLRGEELLFRFRLLKSVNQIVESYVNVPSNPEITAEVRNLNNQRYTRFVKLPGKAMPHSLNSASTPGEYQIKMSGKDGKTIREERFTVGTGITLKYFDYKKKELPEKPVEKLSKNKEPEPKEELSTPVEKPAEPEKKEIVTAPVVKKEVLEKALEPEKKETPAPPVATKAEPEKKVAPPAVLPKSKEPEKKELPPSPVAKVIEPASPPSKTLYFDQSSYILRKDAVQTLDSVAGYLRTRKDVKIHVVGYTDPVGRKDLNRLLSENRAAVVSNYLREKGVNSAQIFYIGKGSDTSATPTDSEESKVRSRRVEILFLDR